MDRIGGVSGRDRIGRLSGGNLARGAAGFLGCSIHRFGRKAGGYFGRGNADARSCWL